MSGSPPGEGINYKSFVEAVYLYFICHQELDMTPGEKIDAAEAVIQKCVKLAKKAGNRQKTAARERTPGIPELLYECAAA